MVFFPEGCTASGQAELETPLTLLAAGPPVDSDSLRGRRERLASEKARGFGALI